MSLRQRRPPNFYIQDAMMSVINITGSKLRVVNSIQGLKSRGRGMPINHITMIQNREKNSFNNPFPTKKRKVGSISVQKKQNKTIICHNLLTRLFI